MNIWGWLVLIFFCIVIVLLCWGACAAGGRADEKMKRIFEKELHRKEVSR